MDDKVGVRQDASTNPTSNKPDIKLDDGPSIPLPDKKLLLFILDRLQKKDRYSVFADPVDPEELPDYHEIIESPMDFSTIRKKLSNGAYATLEQFEKDVFLLCSNAMQYNAPDTIYFRQARTIQELAKKNFESLRQDGDNNEPEIKIVRRGRPPTKHLKKPIDKASQDGGISDCPAAILDTGGESSSQPNYDLRKANYFGKYASPDSVGRANHGSRQGEVYISWSAEKYDRADDVLGYMSKGISMKHGKKQIVFDENRRTSYIGRQDSASALTSSRGDQKYLVPVGLHAEYGYARSLARFAAKLGPVAWKVACKKIERCVPGVKFGPGWVGENDIISQASVPDCNGIKSSENQDGDASSEKRESSNQSAPDNPLRKTPPSISENTTASSPKSPSGIGEAVVASLPGPPFQVHPQPLLQPAINGINGTNGFSFPNQMGKLARQKPGEKPENSSTGKSVDCFSVSGVHPKPGLAGSAPPDLNEGFQSPGSPSRRAESVQPDLALQLG